MKKISLPNFALLKSDHYFSISWALLHSPREPNRETRVLCPLKPHCPTCTLPFEKQIASFLWTRIDDKNIALSLPFSLSFGPYLTMHALCVRADRCGEILRAWIWNNNQLCVCISRLSISLFLPLSLSLCVFFLYLFLSLYVYFSLSLPLSLSPRSLFLTHIYFHPPISVE